MNLKKKNELQRLIKQIFHAIFKILNTFLIYQICKIYGLSEKEDRIWALAVSKVRVQQKK